MSSSTVSKRLCSVIPRQSRALSLYTHQHLQGVNSSSVPSIDYPSPPPARPSPVSTSRQSHSPSTSASQPSSSGGGGGGNNPSGSTGTTSSGPGSTTAVSPQPGSQSQNAAPTPPLQVALTPLARGNSHNGLSSSNPQSIALFQSISFFPSSFPYLTPSTLHQPPSASKRPRHTYHLSTGAYGIPKRRAHSVAMPAHHPELDLAVQVGEDAYFLRGDAMGVADGVGGWSKVCKSPGEANSALFAKSLMHWCSYELALSANPPKPPAPATTTTATAPCPPTTTPPQPPAHHPIDILRRSYDRSLASFQKLGITGGSATALLAVLHDSILHIAHLGDCAICLVRGNQIVYRSEEMQHSFNYPLQLGPSSGTMPGQARSVEIEVRPDDIVILASDGMTDNLWDEDVLDEVEKFRKAMGTEKVDGEVEVESEESMNSGKRAYERRWLPGMLSQALCSRAKSVSESRGAPVYPNGAFPKPASAYFSTAAASPSSTDSTSNSSTSSSSRERDEVPFARKAREEGIKFVGGKCDDISVLVAIISPAEFERTSL